MPKWLTKVLERIRALARKGRVTFRSKALRELEALELGLDSEDVRSLLEEISEDDFDKRIVSDSTEEWLYVFKPVVARVEIYLKVALRNSCIVISFHEDDANEE